MNIWNLNCDVLSQIFSDWLENESLGALDTAVVNHKSRLQFHRLLRRKECVIVSSTLWLDSCPDGILAWILRRGIKFKKMSFYCGESLANLLDIFPSQEEFLEDIELLNLDKSLTPILPELLKGTVRLQALQLFQSSVIHTTDLSTIIRCVPSRDRMLKMVLSGLSEISSEAIRLVGEQFPNVQHLELQDLDLSTPLTTDGLSTKAFSKLHRILVHQCHTIHSDVTEYLFRNASQLKGLDTDCSNVCISAATRCIELQELHVAFCESSVKEPLQQLIRNNRNSLTYIYLIENSLVDAGLSELASCSSLTSLTLDVYESDTPPEFTAAGVAAALKGLQQLTYLAVNLSTHPAAEAFRHLTSLRHLHLLGEGGEGAAGGGGEEEERGPLTNSQGVSLASCCSSLQTLSLGSYGRLLEDSFVLAVAENLSDLRILTLEAPMLTDGSVVQLISKCRRLTILELPASPLLTHKTLLHVVAQAEALTDLTICVDNLTATSVQSLVHAHASLSQVYFRTTSDISRPKYKTFKQTVNLLKEMRPQLKISGVFSDVHCM